MSDRENLFTYQVVMPRLGLTMTEAKIVAWLASDGDWVEKGAPLFEIENEKSTLEIEAPAGGYLQIQAPVGSVVAILQPIALLKSVEKVASYHQNSAGTVSIAVVENQQGEQGSSITGTPSQAGQNTFQDLRATPKARAAARKLGINLSSLQGSGLHGMLVFEDVRRAAERQKVNATPVARRLAEKSGINLRGKVGSGSRGMVMRRDIERSTVGVLPVEEKPRDEIKAMGGLRALIAERLSAAWRERPQVTLTTEADTTFLVAARKRLNEELSQKGGANPEKISYNAILVCLTAGALRSFPYMNVQLTPGGIRQMPEINIGVAVDSERGLLVPVVHNAAEKSLLAINRELGELVERALNGRSLPDDLSGGTFTITNLGMFDIDAFTPVINPPECAILGVGRFVAKPVGFQGQIMLREMVALSLSFDHRLVDGAPAAKFLQRIKQLIECPTVLGL